MSRRGHQALGGLVALAALTVAWKAPAGGHWLVRLLAAGAANLGALWAPILGNRPPRRGPPETPTPPGVPWMGFGIQSGDPSTPPITGAGRRRSAERSPRGRPRSANRATPRGMATAARLGHLSTGAVHGLVGALALTASMDAQARATGFQGALHHLASQAFGTMLLLGLGIGLIADSLWQAVRAATDADLAGPGLRGALERLGWLGCGLMHLGLGVAALRLVRDVPHGPPASRTKAWTATVMALPLGRWFVALVALTILAVAGVMILRAGRAALDPWLDLTQMSPRTRLLTELLGRLGLATRATVYAIIAIFLLMAAMQADPQVARGVTGTLRVIRLERHGAALLAAIGIGFVANGVLEVIRARYRRIAR